MHLQNKFGAYVRNNFFYFVLFKLLYNVQYFVSGGRNVFLSSYTLSVVGRVSKI
jgi:hypothetical protein